jgi:hypothetical protein
MRERHVPREEAGSGQGYVPRADGAGAAPDGAKPRGQPAGQRADGSSLASPQRRGR